MEVDGGAPVIAGPPPALTLYRDTNGWCPFCERVWLSLLAKGVPFDEAELEQLLALDDGFPFDEVEYNRCALQLAAETGLDEIHSLFSFMSMGHVWITAGGKLCGVVSDRALIEACLPTNDAL